MPEQRELSGRLGRNKKREKASQPEFRGSCTIEGTAYWISAWVKEAGGEKFFSLSFTAKDEQPATRSFDTQLDDGVPF